MTDQDAEADEGLWLSISDLAERKGVSKQTISEKVAKLEADGAIRTRPGKNRAKEVNVAQYDLAIGEEGDAAREAGEETKRGEPSPTFRDAQTREKLYQTELLRLKLEAAQGLLLPAAEVKAACEDAAARIVELIDALPAHADDIAAALAREGDLAVRNMLARIARQMRSDIADALTGIADRAAAFTSPESTAGFVQADLPIPQSTE